MRTTIQLPDELFRTAKAHAALRGQSLKELFTEALRSHLDTHTAESPQFGWRSVFGTANAKDLSQVDQIIEDDLEEIDLEDWR